MTVDTHSFRESQRDSCTLRQMVLGSEVVFLKTYTTTGGFQRDGLTVLARAAREAAVLAQLPHATGLGGRLGILQVVESDPERGRLMTRCCPGHPLEQVLTLRQAAARRSALRGLVLAGRWLREFQLLPYDEPPSAGQLPDDPTRLVDYLKIRLAGIQTHARRSTDRLPESRLVDCLRQWIDTANADDKQTVWSHGDYAAFNVLWDGQTLTPIDFAMSRGDWPGADATYFLHRLEMIGLQTPWRFPTIELWRRAFLRGYGREDYPQTSIYRALMLRHLVCRYHSLLRRSPQKGMAAAQRRWIMRQVRLRIECLVQET
jgi:hypothetical protein